MCNNIVLRYEKSWREESDKHTPVTCDVTDITLDEMGPTRHVRQNSQGNWEYEKYVSAFENVNGRNLAQLYVVKQTMGSMVMRVFILNKTYTYYLVHILRNIL